MIAIEKCKGRRSGVGLVDVSICVDWDSTDASVLLEPDIEYDHLIQVMDVVRSAVMPGSGEGEAREEPTQIALFTDSSIGDAP